MAAYPEKPVFAFIAHISSPSFYRLIPHRKYNNTGISNYSVNFLKYLRKKFDMLIIVNNLTINYHARVKFL